MGAARALFEDYARRRDPFVEDETRCRARLGKPDGEHLAFAADECELRLGVTPGQHDAGEHPCDRAVEYGLPIGQRKPGIDCAAEHKDPVDTVRERLRSRKPLLENPQHRGTDGRHCEYQ